MALILREDIRIKRLSEIRSYLLKVILPLLIAYNFSVYLLQNTPIKEAFFNFLLALSATPQYWISIILIFPICLIISDVLRRVISKTRFVIATTISPSYFRIYNKGVWILGVGYINQTDVLDLVISPSYIVFRVKKKGFPKQNLIRRVVFWNMHHIEKHANHYVLTVHIGYKRLDKDLRKIFRLLPKSEVTYFKPPKNYHRDLKERQFSTIANPDDVI